MSSSEGVRCLVTDLGVFGLAGHGTTSGPALLGAKGTSGSETMHRWASVAREFAVLTRSGHNPHPLFGLGRG